MTTATTPPKPQRKPTAEPPLPPIQRKSRQRPPPAFSPNMTPMIDVVFQLLIFFLLAAQFRQPEGTLPANLPEPSGKPGIIQPMRVTIAAAGEDGAVVAVDNETVPMEELRARFEAAKQQQSEEDRDKVGISLQPQGTVRWEHVTNVFNQAILAEITQIGFAGN